MPNYNRKNFTLRESDEDKLNFIAEQLADGEDPNQSETIRRLIHEKAKALGYSVGKTQQQKDKRHQ